MNLRNAGKTNAEVAQILGRTESAVRSRFSQVNIATKAPEGPAAVVEDKNRVDYWRKRSGELERALREAEQSKTAYEVLCEQVHELAPKSYQPAPFDNYVLNAKKPGGTPQSAVLLFSDTHIGAVVKEEQTLGMGHYNFEIFLRRLNRLQQSVFSILQDHVTTPITELVIPILGDMLDGALVHSAEAGQNNTILAQFYAGGHAIAQFLRNVSTIAPVRAYGCVGNHTRWQNQHKMPSKQRNSNFDMLLYLYIQALTKDVPNIVWDLNWQPFATFSVQGFPFYCLHGDNVRGGDKALGIPNHALGRMVGTTTALFTRADKDIPAYYCMGHLHRPIELPHANGEILVNGAFPGIDGYALGEFFNSSRPSQRFFLMHPKFGIAASYKLRLDLGDNTPHKYSLPDVFPCV